MNDHDILIELRTDVKYIKRSLSGVNKTLGKHATSIQTNKDTIEDWTTRFKTLVGVATFVGGVIVFIGNIVWDFFKNKKL